MKVKRILMNIVAILLPWVALFIYDNPGGALVALVLQFTIVGWVPAMIWAWRTVNGKIGPTSSEKTPP